MQRNFTKILQGLHNTSYAFRLIVLKLEILALKQLTTNLMFLFKVFKVFVNVYSSAYLSFNNANTRGHGLKHCHQYSIVNSRNVLYISRVIPIWNSLDADVVISNTTNGFTSKLVNCNQSKNCRKRPHTAT